MERKQIYIAREQEEQLKQLAEREDTTVSALIREAVAVYLVERITPDVAAEEHPLWQLIGIADPDSLPHDGSENHDKYIYGVGKHG